MPFAQDPKAQGCGYNPCQPQIHRNPPRCTPQWGLAGPANNPSPPHQMETFLKQQKPTSGCCPTECASDGDGEGDLLQRKGLGVGVEARQRRCQEGRNGDLIRGFCSSGPSVSGGGTGPDSGPAIAEWGSGDSGQGFAVPTPNPHAARPSDHRVPRLSKLPPPPPPTVGCFLGCPPSSGLCLPPQVALREAAGLGMGTSQRLQGQIISLSSSTANSPVTLTRLCPSRPVSPFPKERSCLW